MVKFKQIIHQGDSGLDVSAIKHYLRRKKVQGYQAVKQSRKAGPAFTSCLKHYQAHHNIKATGNYGPITHEKMAPSFNAYERLLYTKTKSRKVAKYVSPFLHADVVPGRTDMGVDFHGRGTIGAIGDAKIIGNGGRGWPGGHYLLYKLLRGRHAGRYIFVAEAIIPVVKSGQKVKAGQTIAHFGYDAAPGRYPGIEIGWSTSTLNLTLAAATTGYREGERTIAGRAFARFLIGLGVEVRDNPGDGTEFPHPLQHKLESR